MPRTGESHRRKWPNGCQGVQRQREDSWGRWGVNAVGPFFPSSESILILERGGVCASVNILKPKELHTGNFMGWLR